MSNYNKACTEVLEILMHMEPFMIDQLPRIVWENLEKNKDKYYKFKYDENKNLEKQNILNETIDIIAYFYANYWSDETEKQEFKNFLVKKESL